MLKMKSQFFVLSMSKTFLKRHVCLHDLYLSVTHRGCLLIYDLTIAFSGL